MKGLKSRKKNIPKKIRYINLIVFYYDNTKYLPVEIA